MKRLDEPKTFLGFSKTESVLRLIGCSSDCLKFFILRRINLLKHTAVHVQITKAKLNFEKLQGNVTFHQKIEDKCPKG